ncbi:MAG: Hsp20/alpha crystallin family protein [Bacteroidia bacterium]|nr:Hsp20/alpha crystallin family protein [Bacteroidia bacterium]
MENKENDLFKDIKSGVHEIGKQVGKLFGDTFQQQDSPELPVKTDIYTTATHFVIELEIAGIPKNKINIQILENVLSVKGEKNPEAEIRPEQFLRRERKYGSFIRNFDLPANIKLDEIKAKVDNGLLVVRFPLLVPQKEEEDNLNIPIE